MIIGLTGTYCSGKNHIAGFLEGRRLPVLDADKLGHVVIETEKEVILERFGGDILNPDNTINRKLLGEKVFGRPQELAALEAIIHPAVNRLTDAWIQEQNGRPCVINAALLHRSSVFPVLDAVILVQASVFTRLIRAKKRDHLPWHDLVRRFCSQNEFRSQYFSEKADIYKVENPSPFGLKLSLLFNTGAKKPQDRVDEILSLMGIGS